MAPTDFARARTYYIVKRVTVRKLDKFHLEIHVNACGDLIVKTNRRKIYKHEFETKISNISHVQKEVLNEGLFALKDIPMFRTLGLSTIERNG